MARSPVRAIALCEDQRHRSFLLDFLERLNVSPLEVRPAPKGSNGEQWVRLQLLAEAKKFRSRASHQANLVLVVMTDGDRFGVVGRKKLLDEALVAAGQTARGVAERILYLVPTWSIETWLGWLSGEDASLGGINENQTYKGDTAFERLFENTSISVRRAVDRWEPPDAHEATRIPSLADARVETKRIP